MSELKPCPFCGGNNLESGGDDKYVGVRCRDCEAVGPNHYITYPHAHDWNTRPTDDRVSKLVEAAEVAERALMGKPLVRGIIREALKPFTEAL